MPLSAHKVVVVLLASVACGAAQAQNIYYCVDRDGGKIYQDHGCPTGTKEVAHYDAGDAPRAQREPSSPALDISSFDALRGLINDGARVAVLDEPLKQRLLNQIGVFSGAWRPLERDMKSGMLHDPGSYDHQETLIRVLRQQKIVVIETQFLAKNARGAKTRNLCGALYSYSGQRLKGPTCY